MSSEPIIEFKTQEELDACLAYWQRLLFLENWIIKAELCDVDEIQTPDSAGENIWQYVNRTSMIRILRNPPADRIAKVSHEKTLVHELLHLKIIYDFDLELNPQNCLYCNNQHVLIEQMAKTLIMARYGLDHSWFKNF